MLLREKRCKGTLFSWTIKQGVGKFFTTAEKK